MMYVSQTIGFLQEHVVAQILVFVRIIKQLNKVCMSVSWLKFKLWLEYLNN